jgi:hypothetical protein
VRDALMLANHPARQGVDSPHEIRGWRDTAPRVAVGMEGAPGHQAAGIPKPERPGAGRGFYDNTPNPARAFAGYPPESYRTFGGFDWMTSTVGGLWDSLLAEGKPWWISANSDSHTTYLDTTVRGPGSDFATNGLLRRPGVRRDAERDRPATSGPGTTAARTSAPRAVVRRGHGRHPGRPHVGGPRRPARRAWTCGCAPAARRSRSAGCSPPGAAAPVRLVIRIDPARTPELGAVRPPAGQGRRHPRRGHR